MNQEIYLGGRRIAADAPVFIVAEMSANHLQDYDRAIEIIHAAKEAGADAIKLQTYTADTMTVDSDADCFINKGGLWDGIKEYDLYKQAYTPWEWHAGLMEEAKKCGLLCFSSPFDATAVDFLEELDAPAYKIASYEINDIPLIRRVAKLHKPVIFATGVAHLEDIERAMKGMLDPIYEEKVIGHAEIRQIFKASGVGNIAGSYVMDGYFQRGCKVRITREGNQIFEGELSSLKRFKDDVKEVKAGFECGLTFDGFSDIQELDMVEAYIMVEVPR